MRIRKVNEDFYLNDNVVTCKVIFCLEYNPKHILLKETGIGIAKCAPEDNFDIKLGKQLAYQRAKVQALLKIKDKHKRAQMRVFRNLTSVECILEDKVSYANNTISTLIDKTYDKSYEK